VPKVARVKGEKYHRCFRASAELPGPCCGVHPPFPSCALGLLSMQLQENGSDLVLLGVWQEKGVEVPACQVLVAFTRRAGKM